MALQRGAGVAGDWLAGCMRRVKGHVSFDGGASQGFLRRRRGASLFNNEDVATKEVDLVWI
jgi:hypothetical protein